jgi:imidazole glycerol phosphate synthase subunit HisF
MVEPARHQLSKVKKRRRKPNRISQKYSDEADELVFLDISATEEGRKRW